MSAENLSDLIAECVNLQIDLGYARFSHLAIWCDGGDPRTADEGELWRMLERLCVVWSDRHA